MTKAQKKKERKAVNNLKILEMKRKKLEKKSKNIEKIGKNMAIFEVIELYSSAITRVEFKKNKKNFLF